MELLGFVRKEVANKVRRRDSKLQSAKKDREFSISLRNQANVAFRVRVQGKLWNSERALNKPVEFVMNGPMGHVIQVATKEFMKQNNDKQVPSGSMVTVEAVLPNQTRITIPEKFWKKYLKNIA